MTGTQFAERYMRSFGRPVLFVPRSAVSAALRAASLVSLPGFPVSLPEMLAMENTATGRYPVLTGRLRYDDWLRSARDDGSGPGAESQS